MNRSARRVLLRLFLLALPLVVLTFVAVSLLSSNVDSLHSHNALTFASKGKRYLSRTSWLDSSYSLSSLTRRVFMKLVDSFPLLVGFSSNLDSSSEHAHSQSRWTPRLAQVVLIPKRNRMIFKVDVGCVPLFLLLFSSYVPSHRTFFFSSLYFPWWCSPGTKLYFRSFSYPAVRVSAAFRNRCAHSTVAFVSSSRRAKATA